VVVSTTVIGVVVCGSSGVVGMIGVVVITSVVVFSTVVSFTVPDKNISQQL